MLDNRYSRIYYQIIDRASHSSRSKAQGYFELHHILPRSLGGDDSKDNLVLLTAKEHYICHLLLTRMTAGTARAKMLYAYHAMANMASGNQNRTYSNSYEKFKHHFSKMLSEKHSGSNNHFFGKNHTQETKDHLSRVRQGKPSTRPGYSHSQGTKEKLRQAATGKTLSLESRMKLSESTKGISKGNKPWSVTLPSGEVIRITNLKEFCKDQGLNHITVKDCVFRKKPHKGFTFTKLDM